MALRFGGKFITLFGIASDAVLNLITPVCIKYGGYWALFIIRVVDGLVEVFIRNFYFVYYSRQLFHRNWTETMSETSSNVNFIDKNCQHHSYAQTATESNKLQTIGDRVSSYIV